MFHVDQHLAAQYVSPVYVSKSPLALCTALNSEEVVECIENKLLFARNIHIDKNQPDEKSHALQSPSRL